MDCASVNIVAVVLAGGEPNDALAREVGVAAKALMPLRDRPMSAYVLEALRASRCVDQVVYVGPTTRRLDGLYARALPPGRRMVDSLALGVGAALGLLEPAATSRILVLTADIPWITGEGVDRFVSAAPDAALVYPAIAESSAREQFPDQRRTFVRVGGERFTAGNLMLIEPAIVPALLPFVDRAYRARKNPLALANLVGLDLALRLAGGWLDFETLERRVGRLLGAEVRVQVSRDATLGADIDKLSHLETGPSLSRGGV